MSEQLYKFHNGYRWMVSKMIREDGANWFKTHMGKLKCSSVSYTPISNPQVQHDNGGIGNLVCIEEMYDGINYGVFWTSKANSHKFPNHFFWNSVLKTDIL